MIRGMLLNRGIAIQQGKSHLLKRLVELAEINNTALTQSMKQLASDVYHNLIKLDKQISDYTKQIEAASQANELCQRLETIPGIGKIISTAIVSKIGNGSTLKNGRELSAFLGLVPRQYSSGNKIQLGRISKHGDRYIRELLVHGARSCTYAAKRVDKLTGAYTHQDKHYEWIRGLLERLGTNKTSVALANKNARIIMAVLKGDVNYQPELAH